MSESKVTPAKDDSLLESLSQFTKEYHVYRIGFIILLVHAGKIPFDAACKVLGYDHDQFAALCKLFNVVVNDEHVEEDDGTECEEDEPPE